MKRILALLVALVLALGMTALAEAPAAGSLNPVAEEVRGNTSFTQDSVPQVWITPVYAEYIIGKNDPEKYPSKYLSFAPPEGTACMSLRYDQADYIDHDKLALYSYYAMDRASYELFLEKAAEDDILADGSEGVAMYIDAERGRGYALIDLKPQFGGTAKLEILINAYYMKLGRDELVQLLQDEVARVQGAMQLVELPGYWSEGAFGSVTLKADSDPVTARVDTAGLTVTKLETNMLALTSFVSERNVKRVEIELGNYSYAVSKAEDGDETATDETLPDGTVYKSYTTEFTGYAAFVVLENGKHDQPLYLTVKIDCAPDQFKAELEAVYAWIQVEAA